MEVDIQLCREKYTARSTTGQLYFTEDGGSPFCYTLEDTVRADGIKVKRETALPAGLVKVGINFSNRFQREMAIIFTEDNGYMVKKDNVIIKGSRFHGGNTHKDTEGCPLCAKNRINEETIQGSMEKEVTAKIKAILKKKGVSFLWMRITNDPQDN